MQINTQVKKKMLDKIIFLHYTYSNEEAWQTRESREFSKESGSASPTITGRKGHF
jgi:hypothetical protein